MKAQAYPTIGEIAASSLAAVNVFEKYGIDYCCGGKRPLVDVCDEKGMSAERLFKEISEAGAAASPDAPADWSTAPLRTLIAHIVGTHHSYLKVELPRVGLRLCKVVEVHGAKDPNLKEVETVYRELWQELDMHMRKEEMMLFPAIGRYESALEAGLPLPPAPFGTIANPIGVMEAEHASAGWALDRIKELTHNYRAPEWACATYRALLDGLRSLESDLHTHIHLENNILFPRVIALETQRDAVVR